MIHFIAYGDVGRSFECLGRRDTAIEKLTFRSSDGYLVHRFFSKMKTNAI